MMYLPSLSDHIIYPQISRLLFAVRASERLRVCRTQSGDGHAMLLAPSDRR